MKRAMWEMALLTRIKLLFTINLCIDIKAQHCNIKALG